MAVLPSRQALVQLSLQHYLLVIQLRLPGTDVDPDAGPALDSRDAVESPRTDVDLGTEQAVDSPDTFEPSRSLSTTGIVPAYIELYKYRC